MGDSVLVLTPTGRDARIVCDVLGEAGLRGRAHPTMESACQAIEAGAGALLVAEEAIDAPGLRRLVQTLETQEPWSDLPIVLLAATRADDSEARDQLLIGPLRNVIVLERPVRVAVLVTALRVALRARQRQFELRGHLARREQDARDRALALAAERQARREAEEANRLKDEFLAIVSHELRTPVNVILGWSGMLARDDIDAAKRQRALDVIHRNAQAQVSVIDELLDISRINTGKLRMDVEAVRLAPLLEEAADAVRPAADAKRLTLESAWPADLPAVPGDSNRLRQIFFNLLNNAVKFTPEGGRVTLSATASPAHVEVRVADSGIGIAPDVLPFVFDRFRQADSTPSRSYGGLGLGLAIVRQLVELHGGTVDARSAGLGAGSEFIVRLPRTPQT